MPAYNRDIPAGPHNPSADQDPMKTNFNTIDTVFQVDHLSFTNTFAGFHNIVHLQQQLTDPAQAAGSFSQVYSKQIDSINVDEALFYQTGGGRIIQMTVNQVPIVTTGSVGSGTFTYITTFLPGGFLMQTGKVSAPSSSNPVVFPIAFPNNLFSIQVSALSNGSSDARVAGLTAQSLSGFSFQTSVSLSGSTNNFIYWTAIGN